MPDSPKRISPQEASDYLARGYTYLDVRTQEEFAEGRPAGSINVPFAVMQGGSMTPNPAFVSTVEARFPKDAKLVLGCRSGGRSLRAAHALLAAGFTDVIDQRAGWDGVRDPFGQLTEPGWVRAGLPTEQG
ncbi:rhodanese-like domain-containing protein [Pendulispora albinea]|uniref:Rhodanese-like domain-containing protein n=1 Tax=Pendulispora albinea TaxID=2741071 RepID=A0ABZ2LU13_9BACT